MSGFSRGISKLTSNNASVTIADPSGPTADLTVIGALNQLTGDVTAGPGGGSQAATLVGTTNVEGIITANATVAGATQKTATPAGDLAGAGSTYATPLLTAVATAGTTGDATHYPVITIDAKGRVTTATAQALNPGAPLATARETLAGTVATTVVTYTPAAAMNVNIGIYFRVITAATVVTITVTWTDATGAQSVTPVNAVSEAIGSYSLNSFMIDSTATAIIVSITAGTASQVYASASLGGA